MHIQCTEILFMITNTVSSIISTEKNTTSQKIYLKPRFQNRLLELCHAISFFSHAYLIDKVYPTPFGLSVCF